MFTYIGSTFVLYDKYYQRVDIVSSFSAAFHDSAPSFVWYASGPVVHFKSQDLVPILYRALYEYEMSRI